MDNPTRNNFQHRLRSLEGRLTMTTVQLNVSEKEVDRLHELLRSDHVAAEAVLDARNADIDLMAKVEIDHCETIERLEDKVEYWDAREVDTEAMRLEIKRLENDLVAAEGLRLLNKATIDNLRHVAEENSWLTTQHCEDEHEIMLLKQRVNAPFIKAAISDGEGHPDDYPEGSDEHPYRWVLNERDDGTYRKEWLK